MIADTPNTDRARADPGHAMPPSPHARAESRSLSEFVPDDSAVLWIGTLAGDSARALEGRGCRLQTLSVVDGAISDYPDLEYLDFGRARFDVVIAPDTLGRVARPEALLGALRRAIRTDGRLIATVPNAAHPAVVRAIGRGGGLYSADGPIDSGQLRLFTADSLSEAIERADFVVGRLKGITDSRGADVATWSVVALPLPVPGLDRLQTRFRETALGKDEADRTAAMLRAMLSETRRALDAAHLRADSLAAQGREARASILELHRAMLERDRDFEATIRDQLARIAEIEPLRCERDAAHRHAIAAEARCRALELRIEHILMEIPRRLARKLRSMLSGKRSTSKSGGPR